MVGTYYNISRLIDLHRLRKLLSGCRSWLSLNGAPGSAPSGANLGMTHVSPKEGRDVGHPSRGPSITNGSQLIEVRLGCNKKGCRGCRQPKVTFEISGYGRMYRKAKTPTASPPLAVPLLPYRKAVGAAAVAAALEIPAQVVRKEYCADNIAWNVP
jgi:hypothetical protein